MIIKEQLRLGDKYYKAGRFWQAATHYKKVVSALQVIADEETDLQKQDRYYREIAHYMERMRPLVMTYDSDGFMLTGQLLETVPITCGTSNQDFINVFANYCSDSVKEIVIYEFEIFKRTHVGELNKLAQMFIDLCGNLKHIKLKCKRARPELRQTQLQLLRDLLDDMDHLPLNFDSDVEDDVRTRKIVLSTGIVFVFKDSADSEAAGNAGVSAAGDMSHQPKSRVIEVWNANMPAQH